MKKIVRSLFAVSAALLFFVTVESVQAQGPPPGYNWDRTMRYYSGYRRYNYPPVQPSPYRPGPYYPGPYRPGPGPGPYRPWGPPPPPMGGPGFLPPGHPPIGPGPGGPPPGPPPGRPFIGFQFGL